MRYSKTNILGYSLFPKSHIAVILSTTLPQPPLKARA